LSINAKRGEFIGPKQKDRTTTVRTTTVSKKMSFFKNYFTKGKKSFQLQKPS
jgi:hypothetical protein